MSHAKGTPTIEIQLSGESYTLGWTWYAKQLVQEYLKAKYADPAEASKEEQLATALWASLDDDIRSSVSVIDIQKRINPSNEEMVVNRLGSLFLKSEPDPDPNGLPVAANTPTTGGLTTTESQQLASVT